MVAFNKTTLSENVKSITNTMEVDDVCFDDVATGNKSVIYIVYAIHGFVYRTADHKSYVG